MYNSCKIQLYVKMLHCQSSKFSCIYESHNLMYAKLMKLEGGILASSDGQNGSLLVKFVSKTPYIVFKLNLIKTCHT